MLGIARELDIDGVRQDQISGSTDWQGQSYTITGSGTHTLKWRYIKNGSGAGGSDCAWVDYVQSPSPTDWLTITYGYDAAGRRIEKAYDGQTVMKYLYDGEHIIAEYDGSGSLLHKYIYGPGVDQPICMIDVADSNATYYYHFDGLGSVIALTNSAGSVANLYEYSVYGETSASDPNHPNRFLFTGREFDADTGLYYYRARYYNPYIGRFLQTDPAGDGMNPYAYCGNNPIGAVDPTGMSLVYTIGRPPSEPGILTTFTGTDRTGFDFSDDPVWHATYMVSSTWENWADAMASDAGLLCWSKEDYTSRAGAKMSHADAMALAGDFGAGARLAFWSIQALIHLGIYTEDEIRRLENWGVTIAYRDVVYIRPENYPFLTYGHVNKQIDWSDNIAGRPRYSEADESEMWMITLQPIAALAHELMHALDDMLGNTNGPTRPGTRGYDWLDSRAITMQNRATAAMMEWNIEWYTFWPLSYDAWMRPNPMNVSVGPPPDRLPTFPARGR